MYGVRGLGNCPGDPGCPGNVQPVDTGNVCDSTSGMFDAGLCNNLYVPKSAAGAGITATLNQYATPLMYAAGGLLLLMMLKGRR